MCTLDVGVILTPKFFEDLVLIGHGISVYDDGAMKAINWRTVIVGRACVNATNCARQCRAQFRLLLIFNGCQRQQTVPRAF